MKSPCTPATEDPVLKEMDNTTEILQIPSIEDFDSKYRFFMASVFCGTICVTVNLCALCCVTKSNGFTSNYSLINLYVSSFPSILVGLLTGMAGIEAIELKGEWLCGLWSSFRRLSVSLLPTTVVAISLERLQTRQSNNSCVQFCSPVKSFLITWVAALLLSLPCTFTYIYVKVNPSNPILGNNGKFYCKKVLLLGSPWARLAYETIYCLLLNIFPSAYIVYDFHRLKFKLDYLFFFKTIPFGMEEKIRPLRLVFFYSASFIAIWLPFGLIAFTHKVTEDIDNPRAESDSPTIMVLGTLLMAHLACHPLFYFYTHHRMSVYNIVKVFGCLNRACTQKDTLETSDIMTSSFMKMETYNETKIYLKVDS